MQQVELPLKRKKKQQLCKPGIGEEHEGWTDFYCGIKQTEKYKVIPKQAVVWIQNAFSWDFSLCLH